MIKTLLIGLVTSLFLIGCGGDGGGETTTVTVNNLALTGDALDISYDCNSVYYDEISLTGNGTTFELINCDIGDLIFHADNSIMRLINVGAITFDHLGTGNTVQATQAVLDTIDDVTLTEVAITY